MNNEQKVYNPLPPHKVLKGAIRNITLTLYYGNIFSIDTDIIVNPANELMENTGGLALEISEKAGPELRKYCKQWTSANGAIPQGKAIITPSFNLSSRYRGIIHAVGPKNSSKRDDTPSESDQDVLVGTILESFILANKEKMKSISMPAISAGVFDYNLEYAAKNFFQAFVIYAGQFRVFYSEGTLEDIKVVIIDSKVLEHFVREINKASDMFDVFEYYGLPTEVACGLIHSYCEVCERPQTVDWFEVTSRCCLNVCDFCIYDHQLTECPSCTFKFTAYKSKHHSNTFFCRTCKSPLRRSEKCPCPSEFPY